MRTARWISAMMIVVAFPVGAAVAGLAYLILRRKWSDRLIAVVLAALGSVAAYYTMMSLDYWGTWWHVALWVTRFSHEPVTAGEWSTVAGLGTALGLALGAILWMVLQIHRERSPFNGADEKERRQLCEERRRLVVTHTVQRARHTGPRPIAIVARPARTWSTRTGASTVRTARRSRSSSSSRKPAPWPGTR